MDNLFRVHKRTNEEKYDIYPIYEFFEKTANNQSNFEGGCTLKTLYDYYDYDFESLLSFLQGRGAIISTTFIYPHFSFFFDSREAAESICSELTEKILNL